MHWIGRIILLLFSIFFLTFIFSNIKEKEKRALKLSIIFFLFLVAVLVSSFFFSAYIQKIISLMSVILFIIFIILSLIPFEKKGDIKVYKIERVDERDVIFARDDLKVGSKNYEEYYRNHPERKKIDDRIRKLPPLLELGSLFYNPLQSKLASSEFDFLEAQLNLVNGEVSKERIDLKADEASSLIKRIAKYLGAKLVGICEVNKNFYYTHVGRGPEPYGKKINLNHRYGIVFAVEMSFDKILNAPFPPVIIETGKRYVEVAKISIILANYIRSLGYSARAHIAGSNYQAILPPLGYLAGLGELGRLGILITPQYGPRVRLGLVTTDLPLIPDGKKIFGVQNFCEKCLKCALNCPSQAIEYGKKIKVRGVEKWPLKAEKCYQFWKKIGTDCAICVRVCPYSRPNSLLHNLIRSGVRMSSFLRYIFIKADFFFYGKKIPREW
jgi:ferredoxin/Ca2+/Na+ antiporter